ncbi:MAG: hypothetical protein WDO16_07565 [Bacteroidota bacterium]
MTFQNKQEKLFFGIIHILTKDDPTKRLSEEEIISNVSRQVIISKTKELFANFSSPNVKYIEEDDSNRYRISDAGMIYYEQLAFEWESEIQQKKSIDAAVSTSTFTKINIVCSISFAAITLFVLLSGYFEKTKLQSQQSNKALQDSLRQSEILKNVQELKAELHQISLSLKDTSKVKVRIEK